MSQSSLELNEMAFDNLVAAHSSAVALVLTERLQPVEGDGAVIFPPTYAASKDESKTDRKSKYEISILEDGRKIVQIDSVGSQANRIEPIFLVEPFSSLVPQIYIRYGNEKKVSIFEVGHRLGDALIRCTNLADEAKSAFEIYGASGDASAIAQLAPTSIIFGAWDSRETGVKIPRILQSVVRGTDVSVLTRSAQYNPPVDYSDQDVGLIDKARKQASEGNTKSDEAIRGFVAVPAPNELGGVIVHGDITRSVSVNLIALRRLKGGNTDLLRRYILGLTLVAATEPVEAFMRQGCLLTPHPDKTATWMMVNRDGTRVPILLTRENALAYASAAAEQFGVRKDIRILDFEKDRAEKDLRKKDLAEASKKK